MKKRVSVSSTLIDLRRDELGEMKKDSKIDIRKDPLIELKREAGI
jgi:hypothetical protein